MNLIDYLIAAIILLIIGAVIWYLYRSKKKGVKCIGCPDGGKCSGCTGSCGGCSCECSQKPE